MDRIVLENSKFRFIIGEDAKPISLVDKFTNEELLYCNSQISLFSVTQERPFNNENKLTYMNQRTVYQANRITQEDNTLIVGFEIAPYRALVDVDVQEEYINFTLKGFDVKESDFAGISMATPPVSEFRLLQLPIIERENYGRWLNVIWDEKLAINVLASCPHTIIDSECREGYRILHANALKSCKVVGASAALIVTKTEELLDCIDILERDFSLPRGVVSRRDPKTTSSIYWTDSLTPENVDEHIAICKAGGFSLMMLYYNCLFKAGGKNDYEFLGDYDYRDDYPEGVKSVQKTLDKIKNAGITPGLHVLPTHIGIKSRYVTPKADYRLRLKEYYTLAKPLSKTDKEIYVEENPQGISMVDGTRVLRFGSEFISYQDYSKEPPYKFVGCERGHFNTDIMAHSEGEIGGLADISEYGAVSIYIDQKTSLQDEVADKIIEAYNAGFQFMYFDGAEGTNEPYGYYISAMQYKLYNKMQKPPIFCTGAAKTHFGWHMLGGGNAYDIFPTEVFKEKIEEFPVVAAKELRKDFTVVNFGWWRFFKDTQPDTYEYGMSRAIAWDCPVTVMMDLNVLKANPRSKDVILVLRRWQEAKEKGFFDEITKEKIRTSGLEYTLLVNETGNYELYTCEEIKLPSGSTIRAFFFERNGCCCASLWSRSDEVNILLSKNVGDISYKRSFDNQEIPVGIEDDYYNISVGEVRYLSADCSKEEFIRAFATVKEKKV